MLIRDMTHIFLKNKKDMTHIFNVRRF